MRQQKRICFGTSSKKLFIDLNQFLLTNHIPVILQKDKQFLNAIECTVKQK